MSRVVTSADIDALSRVIRQQGLEIQQTNERVARLEQQVRVLNTPSPTPPAPPPVEPVNAPVPAGTLPPYGLGVVENVIAQEALMKLGGVQQDPEQEKNKPGDLVDEYENLIETIADSKDEPRVDLVPGHSAEAPFSHNREDFVSGLAPTDPIGGDTLTESGVASDAATGVSAGGE